MSQEQITFPQALQPAIAPAVLAAPAAVTLELLADAIAENGVDELLKSNLRRNGAELMEQLWQCRGNLRRYAGAINRLENVLFAIGTPNRPNHAQTAMPATDSDDSDGEEWKTR